MTHTILNVQVPAGSAYVDLAYELSRTNHRLYRQGRVYHADVVATNTFAAGGPITVEAIAPTWMNKNAWKLAFDSWRKSTEHERDSGIKAGRWNDFRIYYQSGHAGTPSITNGEYNYTEAVFADGTVNRAFHMFGATSPTRFGILAEYDALRDTDTDTPPAGAASAPYDRLLSEMNNQQADQIQEEGDLPPYDSQTLNPTQQVFHLQSPLGSNYYRTGMMQIPCGLLNITSDGGLLQIRVKAGKYKGVHAEAMA